MCCISYNQIVNKCSLCYKYKFFIKEYSGKHYCNKCKDMLKIKLMTRYFFYD